MVIKKRSISKEFIGLIAKFFAVSSYCIKSLESNWISSYMLLNKFISH